MPRLSAGLRSYLILLVLVVLVPMLVWAGGLTMWNAAQERRVIERGLIETTDALTLAIDQSMRLTMEGLSTLTLSRTLAGGDYVGFQAQARRLMERHPEWLNVILVAHSGQQLVNTARPYGGGLPHMRADALAAANDTFKAVLATGAPAVSSLFHGPVAGQAVVVGVPVTGPGGEITHVLMAGIRPDRLADLLRTGNVPSEWVAALVDRNFTVVARTVQHDQFVGRQVPDWFRRAIEGKRKGIVSGRSLEGQILTVAVSRSDVTGWTTAFGAPREVFIGHLRRTFILTAGFGLVVLVASLALASWMAGRILRPVQALTTAATPYIPSGKDGGTYAVTELDELHRALDGLTEELRESEARFKAVFAVAPVMLFVLDQNMRFQEVNDILLRTMGYRRDEVLGRQPWDFQTPESRAYVREIVPPGLERTGAIDDLPAAYVTKDGDIRDVLVSLRAERDHNGRITRTIGALRDVTEQRRSEKALNRAIKEAAKANDAKSRFLAAASHDLRQPLQALTLYLGVLNVRLGSTHQQAMTAINQCVDSLTGLLSDMLDVARLDAGTIVPKIEDVPISHLIQRMATSWSIQAEAKGLRLSVHGCDAVVRTDPALMERVLSNLVANAVRYTDKGRVLVGCRRAGDHVRLEVWDTGIGIPAEKLGDIFEEFRQLANPERRRDKGTGLGLAIVQRIARLLGHTVKVRSTPGKGSVFSVTLPVSRSTLVTVADAEEGAPPAGPARRILVVEDEVHVRDALELVLTGLGHEVAAGETVDQALARLGPNRPQLVIADYRLGSGTTGVDAIRRVRALFGGDVAAVVLTGDTDPAVIRRIAGEGLPLLHKPLQLEALKGFLGQVA